MQSGDSPHLGHCGKRGADARRYQYSLRAMLVLTGIVAALFSVARSLGYVVAAICLLALMVLWLALRYPRPVRPPTGIFLTLVAGILLLANLRATEWPRQFSESTPSGLGPVTEAMFWRGWPLSPCMVCLVHGMKFHPGGEQWGVLFFDGAVFVVALLVATVACESCLRWRDRRMRARSTVGSSSSVESRREQTFPKGQEGTGP